MHPISDRRLCDECIFMADTFHPDMCLHPARREPGTLGRALDEALHWNADCPVYQAGRPAFCSLLELGLPVEEWEAAGEYLRARLAEHAVLHDGITGENIAHYAASYQESRALVL